MITLIEVKNKNKNVYPFGIPKINSFNESKRGNNKVRFANTNPIDDSDKPYTRVLKK